MKTVYNIMRFFVRKAGRNHQNDKEREQIMKMNICKPPYIPPFRLHCITPRQVERGQKEF